MWTVVNCHSHYLALWPTNAPGLITNSAYFVINALLAQASAYLYIYVSRLYLLTPVSCKKLAQRNKVTYLAPTDDMTKATEYSDAEHLESYLGVVTWGASPSMGWPTFCHVKRTQHTSVWKPSLIMAGDKGEICARLLDTFVPATLQYWVAMRQK